MPRLHERGEVQKSSSISEEATEERSLGVLVYWFRRHKESGDVRKLLNLPVESTRSSLLRSLLETQY
jgi:hypothetical protein